MLGWLFGRKPKKPKWTINLHGSLRHSAQLAAAWTVHAGVKSMVRDGSYADNDPEARGKDTPFDDECFAHNVLAEFWGVQTPEVQATDPYLKLRAGVRSAGLIREYVWRYLREPGWPERPGLELGKLDAWLASAGVGTHQPVTLAFVVPG
jgi:hypothetical protein